MAREIDRQEIVLDIPLENGIVEQASTLFLPKRLGGTSLKSVLLLPEFGRNREQFEACADAIANADDYSVCMAVDLLGHGESEGERQTLTIQDQLMAAEIAYDYLIAHYGDSMRGGAIGASFGAYIATRLAWTKQQEARSKKGIPIKSLLLRVPGIYPLDFETKTHEDYAMGAQNNGGIPPGRYTLEKFREDPEQLEPALEHLRNFEGTTTIVASECDTRIREPVIKAYCEAAQHPELIVMRGIGHMLETEEQQRDFQNIAINWTGGL
jgi:hypothetical protein